MEGERERDRNECAREARALAPDDPEYPHGLDRLSGSPPTVYVRGAWERRGWRVALVGARDASPDGAELAFELAAALASRGVEILSGLALGIDAAAHRGALSVSGRTGAVLGTPLGACYPREHAELQEDVAFSVGLLTELPAGTHASPSSFASRNRLLAALSDAVVVVEGRARSGALQTAEYASAMNRPVGAVPWSLWCERGAAPLHLLQEGSAALVRGPEDVLALLPQGGAWPAMDLPRAGARERGGAAPGAAPRVRSTRSRRPWVTAAPSNLRAPVPGSVEARVLAALRERPQTPDEIALQAGTSFRETSSVLLCFEMEGRVRREFGGRVRLARKLRFTTREQR